MATMQVAVTQAHLDVAIDFAVRIVEGVIAGRSVESVLTEDIVDEVLQKYEPHIRAAFARYGINVEPGQKLNEQWLIGAINQKTGLNLTDLTPSSVQASVNGLLSRRMTETLGVEITDVTNVDTLKQQLMDAAILAVTSGRATALVTGAMIKKIRNVKTFKESGIDPDEKRKVMARYYQKKYRRTHFEVWEGSAARKGSEHAKYGDISAHDGVDYLATRDN